MISWARSRARKLLYTNVKQEKIPLDAKVNGKRTTDINDVYLMHEEYFMWDYEKFSGRLAGGQKIIKRKNTRADEDRAMFDKFVETNPVSYFSHKGYIQWQGSESERLLKKTSVMVQSTIIQKKNISIIRCSFGYEHKNTMMSFLYMYFVVKLGKKFVPKNIYIH
mmetsp:Transcript_33806/g.34284  ORF Transcript_33806/g.34284 Transcript_33806/m.34284 type:complete len:165 (-) Transcript_33806:17-511(-)